MTEELKTMKVCPKCNRGLKIIFVIERCHQIANLNDDGEIESYDKPQPMNNWEECIIECPHCDQDITNDIDLFESENINKEDSKL